MNNIPETHNIKPFIYIAIKHENSYFIGYVYDIKREHIFVPSCAQSDHTCVLRCSILEKTNENNYIRNGYITPYFSTKRKLLFQLILF